MTGPAEKASRSTTRVLLALRLAWRDMRGGFKGFRIFLACIALGVAAIVGVGSTARSLSESVSREGQRILGGDLSLGLIHREMNDEELRWVQDRGRVASVAVMRAMARRQDGASALVELKAVGSDYPRLGALVTEPTAPIEKLLGRQADEFGFVAEDALLARLDLKVGDRIFIGDSAFRLRAVLRSEPDKLASGVGFGPRVIVSQQAFRTTGLLQPGSLVRWVYRVILPESAPGVAATDKAVDAFITDAGRRFPEAGWQVRSRSNVSPQFSRNLERFTQFLTLVGLTALVVGGVGVANAVRGYVDRKTPDLATLKSLGATGGYVFALSLVEVLMVTAIGVAVGVAVGAMLPFLVAGFLGSSIPVPFEPSVYPGEALGGVLYGFLVSLAFSLGPLGRTHDVSVSALYRDRIEGRPAPLRKRYLALIAAAATALVAAIVAPADDHRLTLTYVAATLGGFIALRAVGSLVMWAARRAPHSRWTELRLAVANLHRPGAITQPVVLSLGLGLALLATLTLIDSNIRSQLQQGLPGKAPSFFFIDIPNRQADEFEAFIHRRAPEAEVVRVPMMRGRLVRVNDVPAEQVRAQEQAAWVLEGDRGITYSAEVPEGSSVAKGEWWARDYRGDPLVSMEEEIAEGLGVGIGDTITVNVLGRNITARVANLRRVNWRSLGINFVFVFSPNAFAGAPHMHLATAAFPRGAGAARELALLKDVATAYPTVTSVRVKDTLDAIARIADQLALAVRGATSIALIASMLVLGGALSAGQRGRIYDAVVLKTLGATRGRLLFAYILEYSALGLATAGFAVLAGSVAAWAILVKVMKLEEFVWAWTAATLPVLVALLVTVTLGLAATWRILGQKPARHLRDL